MEALNNFWGILFLIVAGVVLVQIVMSIINGTDLDIDLDGDGSGDFDLGTIVSPKGVLHFLFGGSGYLTLMGPERWTWWNYLLAILVGLVVAGLMFLLYYGMSKLAEEKKQEKGEVLVGRSGVVYLPIDSSTHTYEITIERNERIQSITVKSKSGNEYKTGDFVTIVEYIDGVYYID